MARSEKKKKKKTQPCHCSISIYKCGCSFSLHRRIEAQRDIVQFFAVIFLPFVLPCFTLIVINSMPIIVMHIAPQVSFLPPPLPLHICANAAKSRKKHDKQFRKLFSTNSNGIAQVQFFSFAFRSCFIFPSIPFAFHISLYCTHSCSY